MSRWIILASGPSLANVDLDKIKALRDSGHVKGVIAVNNVGLDKAPWANVLVAGDRAWWWAYPEALQFKGRKFSRLYEEVEIYKPPFGAINSGLMAMYVARDVFKASELWLFGFDMKGTHYFGPHTQCAGGVPLQNATPSTQAVHIRQFTKFDGAEVFNFNPDSGLTRYPFKRLEDVII